MVMRELCALRVIFVNSAVGRGAALADRMVLR